MNGNPVLGMAESANHDQRQRNQITGKTHNCLLYNVIFSLSFDHVKSRIFGPALNMIIFMVK
jgi:5-methylcytosine-specific restriction endonuclease McrA